MGLYCMILSHTVHYFRTRIEFEKLMEKNRLNNSAMSSLNGQFCRSWYIFIGGFEVEIHFMLFCINKNYDIIEPFNLLLNKTWNQLQASVIN